MYGLQSEDGTPIKKAMESHVCEFRFAPTPQYDVLKRSHPCTMHGKRVDEYADVYNASCRCGSSMHCSDSAFSSFASEPCTSSTRIALHSHHAAPSGRRTHGSTEGRILQGPTSGPRTTGGIPTSGPRATGGTRGCAAGSESGSRSTRGSRYRIRAATSARPALGWPRGAEGG